MTKQKQRPVFPDMPMNVTFTYTEGPSVTSKIYEANKAHPVTKPESDKGNAA